MAKKKKNLADMVKAPRKIDIDGQLHMLAWITADEGKALKLLGGAGTPGPMGIPAYYSGHSEDTEGDTSGTYGGDTDTTDETGQDDDMNYTDPDYGYTTKGPDGRTDMENASLIGFQAYNDRQPNPGGDDPIKKAIQEVAEKIPDESPLTDAMKAYYGKGIGTSTIDMSTAAGRATSLANMTSPSTSAIGGKFDPATGRYIFPDGRIFDTATGKFLPISQSNKIEGLDLFRPLEGVK